MLDFDADAFTVIAGKGSEEVMLYPNIIQRGLKELEIKATPQRGHGEEHLCVGQVDTQTLARSLGEGNLIFFQPPTVVKKPAFGTEALGFWEDGWVH